MKNIALCLIAAGLILSAEDNTPATTQVLDPVTATGKIIVHIFEGDSPRHSIVVYAPDKSSSRLITVEFNRSEPALLVGANYLFTYKPVMNNDDKIPVITNGRQIFELLENSIVINPPQQSQ